MMRFWTAATLLALLLAPVAPVAGEGLSGGIAVGVSADGKQLVAGGKNRALYELDPVTLDVKRRVYLGRQVQKIAFSPSGKTLIVESSKVVQWLAAESLTVTKTLEKASRITLAPKAGLVAVNVKSRPYSIKLLDIETGAERAALAYDSRQSVAAFALSPDGKKVAILYYRKRGDVETDVPYKEIPKNLKGAALNEFKQKNDGYTSQFVIIDVASSEPLLDKRIWFGAPGGGNSACWHGNMLYVVGYENQNVAIDAEGNAEYFELGNSYNYAREFSADGSLALTGGLRDGSRTTMADRKGTSFELDRIDGHPEYFKSFSFASDGTSYAGTTASRVVRIGADGVVVVAKPVF